MKISKVDFSFEELAFVYIECNFIVCASFQELFYTVDVICDVTVISSVIRLNPDRPAKASVILFYYNAQILRKCRRGDKGNCTCQRVQHSLGKEKCVRLLSMSDY